MLTIQKQNNNMEKYFGLLGHGGETIQHSDC